MLRAGLAVVLAAFASAAPLSQGVALGAEDDRACADIIDGGATLRRVGFVVNMILSRASCTHVKYAIFVRDANGVTAHQTKRGNGRPELRFRVYGLEFDGACVHGRTLVGGQLRDRAPAYGCSVVVDENDGAPIGLASQGDYDPALRACVDLRFVDAGYVVPDDNPDDPGFLNIYARLWRHGCDTATYTIKVWSGPKQRHLLASRKMLNIGDENLFRLSVDGRIDANNVICYAVKTSMEGEVQDRVPAEGCKRLKGDDSYGGGAGRGFNGFGDWG